MDSIENGEVANPLLTNKESVFVPLKSGAQRMSGETDRADDEEEEGEEESASTSNRGRVSFSKKAENGKMSSSGRKEVRKSISFSSLVKVKTIDLPHITYQGLKQVAADEVPLGMMSRGEIEGGGDLEALEAGTRNGRGRNNDSSIPEDESVEDPSPRSEGSQKVYSPLMAEEEHSSASRESLLPRVRYSNGAEFFESMDSSQKSLATNLAYLMRQKQIVVSTTLYGFSSFVVVIGNEIFTLWVVTSRADGGLSYNTQQIGVAVMICGVIGTLLQLTLFPYASDRLGTLGVHRYGGLMFAANSLFIPCIPYISSNPTITMIIVVLALTMQSVAATWYLISTFVLISNSCYSHQLATVNGIGQTCASLGRLSGPYLGSVLFAWSETNGMEWPFNQYLVYYLLALLCVLIYQYSFLLPKSIQRRKREPKFRNWDDADAHYRREQEREQTLAQEREQGQEQKQGEQQLSQLTQTKGNNTDSGAPQIDIDSAFKTGNSELIVREPEILNGKEENALK
uniref:Major facilitator superfamily (MFS) profile domain-containing protein n=1 Tax=Spumella elongata TaxID=89044 RepID=A0A7S3HCF8_9STRA|mmetsp:Transcript_45441/g.79444  ORF Transcript_45441/g.79444 Transcript_45441/m.79444 type:complete len:513 (+) Transcript_45441:2-1540(+)